MSELLEEENEGMTEQTIYKKKMLEVTYDNNRDEICVDMVGDRVWIPYFTLEEIMQNARIAHVTRNNLRLEDE